VPVGLELFIRDFLYLDPFAADWRHVPAAAIDMSQIFRVISVP
jgi:hypothetical protein